MSDLSEKKPKLHLNSQERFAILLRGMRRGKTFGEIAEKCGCSYKTVERDFWEWRLNGGFEKFVFTELILLHDEETQKEKGSEAYRVIADLAKRFIKEKVQVEGSTEIIIKSWDLGNANKRVNGTLPTAQSSSTVPS